MSGVVVAGSLGVAAGLGASALTASAALATGIGLATAGIGFMASKNAGKQTINLPAAQVPAAPASGARADTGASVQLGTTVKDQRVSGSRASGSGSKSNTVDVLGGLGGGGLSV